MAASQLITRPMRSYLGLPLHIGDHFVGMLGLANHEGGFDESWVESLEPLTATIAQLIEAYRTQMERRKDQTAIARLSQVASQMTNAIVITDLGGRIEWTNDAFTRLFGYHLDDVAGLRPRDLLLGPMSDPQASLDTYEAMERKEVFAIEQVVADRRGRTKWVEVNGTPLRIQKASWRATSSSSPTSASAARRADEDRVHLDHQP